jgi:tetratricopeptide (TPR) repeat protein
VAVLCRPEPEHPNYLRKWIDLRGYKVKRLADQTGIPLRTLWEYIGERVAIEPDRLKTLAAVLSCSPEQLVLGYAKFSGSDEMNKKRRELLQLLGIAGAALLFPSLDVDWERIGDSLLKPSHLDAIVIQDLEAINGKYWSLYLATTSKSSVLDGVLGQLKMLVQFLRESHTSTVHQRICALSSDLSQLAGEIFFDRHEYTAAQACYIFAASAAKEAKAFDLGASAFVRHAFLPIYEEEFEDALPLLKEAQRLALRGDQSLPTRFWIAAVEAEAESGVHNLAACQSALDRANGVVDLQGSVPPWTRFDGSRLPALRGACYVRLVQPDLAAASLKEALAQYTKPGRKRGMVLMDLAIAALQFKDIEQACNYMHEVVDVVTFGSSSFLKDGIFKVRQQLEPFAGSVAVNGLDQRVRLLI